jgi:hypothetical protein
MARIRCRHLHSIQPFGDAGCPLVPANRRQALGDGFVEGLRGDFDGVRYAAHVLDGDAA